MSKAEFLLLVKELQNSTLNIFNLLIEWSLFTLIVNMHFEAQSEEGKVKYGYRYNLHQCSNKPSGFSKDHERITSTSMRKFTAVLEIV